MQTFFFLILHFCLCCVALSTSCSLFQKWYYESTNIRWGVALFSAGIMSPHLASGWWTRSRPQHKSLYKNDDMLLPDTDGAPDWQDQYQKRVSTITIIMGNCCERLGPQKNTYIRVSLPAVCFVWQIAMIVLFGVFIRYDKESDSHWVEYKHKNNLTDIDNDFYFRYPSKYEKVARDFSAGVMDVWEKLSECKMCFCQFPSLSWKNLVLFHRAKEKTRN